jgi:hypothetical protein
MCKDLQGIEIKYSWSDEDTGNNCGFATYKDGVFNIIRLQNQSKEAYDLAFELRPDYKEYYKLVDGVWEYDEKEDE